MQMNRPTVLYTITSSCWKEECIKRFQQPAIVSYISSLFAYVLVHNTQRKKMKVAAAAGLAGFVSKLRDETSVTLFLLGQQKG